MRSRLEFCKYIKMRGCARSLLLGRPQEAAESQAQGGKRWPCWISIPPRIMPASETLRECHHPPPRLPPIHLYSDLCNALQSPRPPSRQPWPRSCPHVCPCSGERPERALTWTRASLAQTLPAPCRHGPRCPSSWTVSHLTGKLSGSNSL